MAGKRSPYSIGSSFAPRLCKIVSGWRPSVSGWACMLGGNVLTADFRVSISDRGAVGQEGHVAPCGELHQQKATVCVGMHQVDSHNLCVSQRCQAFVPVSCSGP
ncbi:unnamed protein product [Ostreobium quekettii]|uniref:Uncharacterized protein n=1 Tax=Ostreobium quekettii TaxID=121088 RepID=A0A8S1J7Q4_9CHLO|nr:unnamed protein product [Ostreobium quekettii]